MTTFRVVAILVLGGTLAALTAHLRIQRQSWKAVREFLSRHSRLPVEVKIGSERGNLLVRVRVLVYRAALLFTFALAVTGFLPLLFQGEHLTGVLLLVHVTVAPLFALLLAAAALLWAHHQRLDRQHFILLKKLISRELPASEGIKVHLPAQAGTIMEFALRAGFWLLLLLSLPLMLSIILGMFPLFGTDGGRMLAYIHGYTALCITAAVLVHTYGLACQRDAIIGKRTKEETQ